MCSPNKPPKQEPIPEAVRMPKSTDSSVRKAGSNKRRLMSGLYNDVKTSSRGLGSAAATQKKRLLGQ